MLFEVKDIDRDFYQRNLKDFLPEKIIDIHTHLWLDPGDTSEESNRTVTWPSRVAASNSLEDLRETYRLMFPDKKCMPLVFGTLSNPALERTANDYVGDAALANRLPALLFSYPQWPGDYLRQRLQEKQFLGIKSYLSYAPSYLPAEEIRIFDFFPHHQLEVIDKLGYIVMLHIPRPGRLKDPVNLAQMIEIEEKYPNIKLVIAHVGRAYCQEDVGEAFSVLAGTKKMYFDFSANTNQQVFEQMIKAIGPERILFGSDLPITRMRMRRIEKNGLYVNLVPKGLYGDVSQDKNMGVLEGPEAEKLTFFMYEQINAFRLAAANTGLTAADIEKIFYTNALALCKTVAPDRTFSIEEN